MEIPSPKLKLQPDGPASGSRSESKKVSKDFMELMMNLETSMLLDICGTGKINSQICDNPDFWAQRYIRDYKQPIPTGQNPKQVYLTKYFNNLDVTAWDLKLSYQDDPNFIKLKADSERLAAELDKNLQQTNRELKKVQDDPKLSTLVPQKLKRSVSKNETMEAVGTLLQAVNNSPYGAQVGKLPGSHPLVRLSNFYHNYEVKIDELDKISYTRSNLKNQYAVLSTKLRDKINNLRIFSDIPRTYRAFSLTLPGSALDPNDIDRLLPYLKNLDPQYVPENLDLFVLTLRTGNEIFGLILDNTVIELSDELTPIVNTLSDITGEKFSPETIKLKYRLK